MLLQSQAWLEYQSSVKEQNSWFLFTFCHWINLFFVYILQMIRMVPTPKLPSSNFEANDDTSATPDHTLDDCSSLVDFNLDLLPSENLLEDSRNLDLPPLSPDSACLTDFSSLSPPSPNDQALLSPLTGSCTSDFDLDLSATMFSPSADVKVNSSAKMGCLGSPGSTQSSYGVPSPSSPYSR